MSCTFKEDVQVWKVSKQEFMNYYICWKIEKYNLLILGCAKGLSKKKIWESIFCTLLKDWFRKYSYLNNHG